jgi:DNA (cytosine-5)-methyltransferase 1
VWGLRLRFLSLFSGIEAASQAWKPLGWGCVGVSEIEAFPCNALAQIHPDVPNLGDITKITELDIFTLGQIDLVVFGSPCQDLSVAGKRKGLDGARSGLFHDAMRVVGWARKHGGCRFALWENVPGAFSSNGGDDFGVVVGQMAGLDCPTPPKGWGTEGATVGTEAMVEWSVLDAQWFGVAQRRRRVFAIADFGDWANRPPILLEPQGLRGDTAPSREAGQSFTGTIEANIGRSRGAGASVAAITPVHTATCGGIGDYSSSSRSNAIRASGADLGRGCEVLVSGEFVRPVRIAEPVICAATGQAGAEITTGFSCSLTCAHETPYVAYSEGVLPFDTTQISSPTNISNPKVGDPCHPLQAQIHVPSITYQVCFKDANGTRPDRPNGGAYSFKTNIAGARPLYLTGAQSDIKVLRPIAWSEELTASVNASGTMVKGGEGGGHVGVMLPNMQVRRLTPRECERLQGFPDDHTLITVKGKPAADGPRYKALGNSMAVPVMHWIGKRIDIVNNFF